VKICVLSCFEDSLKKNSGASVRISNLAKGLSSQGNSVSVILPSNESTCKTVDGLKVFFIKGFLPNGVLKVLAKVVGLTRPTSFYFYDFLFILSARKISQEADIVQFEGTGAGLLTVLFKRLLKKKVIIDCHDVFQALRLQQTGILRRMLETSIEKLDYSNADLLLAVSESERKYLVYMGFKKNKIQVIPNGVDTKSFVKSNKHSELPGKYGLEGSRIVTFVGNLDYLPNREAINALSSVITPRVLEKIRNVRFLVVGKSQDKIELPRLTFTGFVEDVSEILNNSDVAVAPLFHGSGTRLKILEYFSCSLPVVSTSIGAEGLDVENGVNILIEDDLENFSLRIVELLKNEQLSTALGNAARALVKSTYDWTEISGKLGNAMNRLLSQHFVKLELPRHSRESHSRLGVKS
jgi:glycosyltransferase involved in cell wall biosynthesis